MLRSLLILYNPLQFASTVAYMLQNTEYAPSPYLKWLFRVSDFSRIMYRRQLVKTVAARLLRLFVLLGILVQSAVGVCLIVVYYGQPSVVIAGLIILLSAPHVWALMVVVPLWLGGVLLVHPRQRRQIQHSRRHFKEHKAARIAVVGSYGKTTMKEILNTVLSEGLKVLATPGNKNVPVSHAHFAKSLSEDEDVLVLEYGEGSPGDIAKLASQSQPTHAIITGLAPAHLDRYKTLSAAAEDIFSIVEYVPAGNVYINTEADSVKPYLMARFGTYDSRGALGWNVKEVEVQLTGTKFVMQKGKQRMQLETGLIGEHLLGPLALAVALALEFGLSIDQVKAGVARTQPFEHRMQPYQLSGAWIIDDTYNGNIEGIKAGTNLLAKLEARRKIYITPGLVDQGEESPTIHRQIGKYIAAVSPDVVVLMKNTVTDDIQAGLREANYTGALRIEDKPLEFYTNLEHFIAAGDLVLMQNDWPDNYA